MGHGKVENPLTITGEKLMLVKGKLYIIQLEERVEKESPEYTQRNQQVKD